MYGYFLGYFTMTYQLGLLCSGKLRNTEQTGMWRDKASMKLSERTRSLSQESELFTSQVWDTIYNYNFITFDTLLAGNGEAYHYIVLFNNCYLLVIILQ